MKDQSNHVVTSYRAYCTLVSREGGLSSPSDRFGAFPSYHTDLSTIPTVFVLSQNTTSIDQDVYPQGKPYRYL